VSDSSLRLHHLHNHITNAIIPNFPLTGDAVKELEFRLGPLYSQMKLILVASPLDALIALVGMPAIGNDREMKIVGFKRKISAHFD
jgi:hypothetical protein